jgi:uncharacterized protein YndB with AHSA1/START domain
VSERTVQHDTLVIDRTFNADATRVFAAWASPQARKQWSVPDDGWEIADDQDDFRVGGHEVSHFGPPGDPRYRAETNYFDIVDNTRIVMAGAMYDRDTRISVSLATVEFMAVADGTRVIYTEQAAFLDGRDTPRSRRQGWNQIFKGLDRFLQSRQEEGARR